PVVKCPVISRDVVAPILPPAVAIVLEDDQAATGFQHASNFPHQLRQILNMGKNVRKDSEVELPVVEWPVTPIAEMQAVLVLAVDHIEPLQINFAACENAAQQSVFGPDVEANGIRSRVMAGNLVGQKQVAHGGRARVKGNAFEDRLLLLAIDLRQVNPV